MTLVRIQSQPQSVFKDGIHCEAEYLSGRGPTYFIIVTSLSVTETDVGLLKAEGYCGASGMTNHSAFLNIIH